MITAVPVQNALLMGGYGIGQSWYSRAGGVDDGNANNNKRCAAIFVGGCVGGVAQSFVMSPVELIKVSRQCGIVGGGGANAAAAGAALFFGGGNATTAWRRGLGATLLRDGIPHGVWFLTYDICKRYGVAYFKGDGGIAAVDDSMIDDKNLPVAVPLASGAIAASVAWGVGYPADLIKTRIQYNYAAATAAFAGNSGIGRTPVTTTTGILDTGRQLVKEADGNVVRGLYKGFGMKLFRSVPASMIGFTVYEFVKEQITKTLHVV